MENTTNNKFIVTGLFKDKASAECAYDALTARGYDKDSSDVVMSDQTRDKYYSGSHAEDTELGSKALEGTGTGAAIGGTLGAIIAGIAAIGTSVLLPGLGFKSLPDRLPPLWSARARAVWRAVWSAR